MITRPNVKINLGLNVLRKREDGYHDLETLFVPYFGFHDTLEIIRGDDWSRTSASLFERYGDPAPEEDSDPDGGKTEGEETRNGAPRIVQAVSPDGRLMITVARAEGVDWDPLKDLTAKAFFLLAADFDLPPVKIFLEKTSPVGAGLGGGSADAAFALRMLSELAGLGLSDSALAAYAARLGSDCAFFIYNKPMLGAGRGELLSPAPAGLPEIISLPGVILPDGHSFPGGHIFPDGCSFPGSHISPDGHSSPGESGMMSPHDAESGPQDAPSHDALRLAVVIPEGIAVSTAEAYRGIVPHLPYMPLRDIITRPIDEWKHLLINDFEATVFPLHPSLDAIKQSLYDRGARYAAMSGSGSALFGLF